MDRWIDGSVHNQTCLFIISATLYILSSIRFSLVRLVVILLSYIFLGLVCLLGYLGNLSIGLLFYGNKQTRKGGRGVK